MSQEHLAEHSSLPQQHGEQQRHNTPPFPSHAHSRVWFITAGEAPIATSLARRVIDHGDTVIACIRPFENESGSQNLRYENLRSLLNDLSERGDDAASRLKVICCDIRSMAECQAAVAEAIKVFDHIDILLCCSSEALVGTIEELSQSPRTESLVNEQFATNFFSAVNIIKALLPSFRAQRSGHIVLLTGITGHLGTPGLGMYCASQWAIEGYCDSLAYEIAPFNVKISILQSNIEVSILTNKLTTVPAMAPYTSETNPAPLARVVWSNILNRMHDSAAPASSSGSLGISLATEEKPLDILNNHQILSLYPQLPSTVQGGLIAETVHAIIAIGGHENPPSRHIVGHEGVASVKEKLRTVSEELEDFVECSGSVDL